MPTPDDVYSAILRREALTGGAKYPSRGMLRPYELDTTVPRCYCPIVVRGKLYVTRNGSSGITGLRWRLDSAADRRT